MSTTVHTPKSMHITAVEQPFADLRLLAEVSTHKSILFKNLPHTKLSLSMTKTHTKNNSMIFYYHLVSCHSLLVVVNPLWGMTPARSVFLFHPPQMVEEPQPEQRPASPEARSCRRLMNTSGKRYRKPCLRSCWQQ